MDGGVIMSELSYIHFKVATDISMASVVITDKKANILYVNDAFTENTGYTLDEVKGKNPSILQGDDANNIIDYKEMWEILTTQKEWNGEFYNKDKNGNHFWEFAHILQVTHEDKIYYVGVKQNITRLKSVEEKLLVLHNKAEHLLLAVRVFLAKPS